MARNDSQSGTGTFHPTTFPPVRLDDALPVDALEFARAAASVSDPVLIVGETGSGKTHLAKLIHSMSTRAKGAFVPVNVGSLSETLFEGELFGHVRGAFTGANEAAEGLFETADAGTLLLDEIGDLPPELQFKLLRVLEDMLIRRVGSTRYTPVDVRVIAATNANLWAMIEQRRFRSDLYYRIAILTFRMRPLREQRDRIPALARTLLERLAGKAPPRQLSPAALEMLKAYSWPGNIRELDNVLHRAAASCVGDVIDVAHIRAHVTNRVASGGAVRIDATHGLRYEAPADPSVEREMILRALAEEHGNHVRAARRLGRTTLYMKMARYDIPRKEGSEWR